MIDQRVAAKKQAAWDTLRTAMTRRLKCRIDPGQSPCSSDPGPPGREALSKLMFVSC
jgi:hypothetical protein